MNCKPKVSVIIPVYGVEKYIVRCARSLFEQTLNEMEYIFVNDCTPDNSIGVLEQTLCKYPIRREQVKIIDLPENQGAAKAREIGIKAAIGEYVIQCDGDDWVDKNMYHDMYEKAWHENLDMVMCKSVYYSDGVHHRLVTDEISTDKSELLNAIVSQSTSVSLWNRLVRREVFQDNEILFPSAHMMEDMALSAQITYYSARYGCLEKAYYYYFQREDSICGDNSEKGCLKKWSQSKQNLDLTIYFLKQKGVYKEYKKGIFGTKCLVKGFLFSLLKRNLKCYWKWFSTYPEINIQFLFSKQISKSMKAVYFMALLGLYPIFCRIRNEKT